MAKTAREKAKEIGISVTVSIVDQSGILILTMRETALDFLLPKLLVVKLPRQQLLVCRPKKWWNCNRIMGRFGQLCLVLQTEYCQQPVQCPSSMMARLLVLLVTGDQDHECAVAAAEALMQLVK